MQHIIGKIAFAEKAADVMDKNSMIRQSYVAAEQLKESLRNSQTVINVKELENPNIKKRDRNKKYFGRKIEKKNEEEKKDKKFVEEDSGHNLDLKG